MTDWLQQSLDRIWAGVEARVAVASAHDDSEPGPWGSSEQLTPTAPDERLVARFKAAWCTGPLHQLEQNKGLRHWERYQLLELALLAIDTIVEQMELSDGARPDAVRELLAGTAGLQVPEDAASTHVEVADVVLGSLLEPLEVTIGHNGQEQAYERRQWSERLIEEIQTEDGRFQLRASHAAVNVLVGALDLDDIESAMAAAEAALDSLVRRGRLGAAERRARDAQKLSKTYAEDIRRLISMCERSYASVSWDEQLRPRLQEAYAHLSERVETETAMAGKLEEMADEVQDRTRLATILDVVRGCIYRHRELHTAVMTAQAQLLDAQELQAFRPVASLRLVNLQQDVLEPVLDMRGGPLAAALTDAFSSFTPARAPRVLGYGALLARMLAPERERHAPLGEELVDDRFRAEDLASRFTPETVRSAAARLQAIARPTKLSELIGADEPELARYLTLAAAAATDPEPHPGALVSTPTGATLVAGAIYGDDLLIALLEEDRDEQQ